MSGADRVRGGFDSHAFPPSLPARLAGLVLAGGLLLTLSVPSLKAETLAPAREVRIGILAAADTARTPGVSVAGDSVGAAGRTAAGADSSGPAPGTLDAKPRAAEDPLDEAALPAKMAAPPAPRLLNQPRFVMFRSLLVPGWGQLHNRKWVKAALVAGAEGLLIARLIDDDRALARLDDEVVLARSMGDDAREQAAIASYNARLDTFVARQWYLGGLVAYALLDAYVDAHFTHFEIEFRPVPPGTREAGGHAGLRWTF